MPTSPGAKDTYVYSSFSLLADIEGFGTFKDVVAISGTFAVNTIPRASLVLACGVKAQTGEPATAHKILSQIKARAKVKVTLELKTTDGKKEKSPTQKIVVFDGYYAGFGFQRAQDNAQFTLHLVHWLDDLNAGSMLSRNFFPGAGYSLAENANSWTAAARAKGVSTGGSGIPVAIPALDPNLQWINAGNAANDFWAESLKPVLLNIANWPRPDEICKPNEEQAAIARGEDPIKAALNKMSVSDNSKATLPLDLSSSLDPAIIGTAINNGLGQSGLAGFNYSTFWSVLVGVWGPAFLFAISPSVEWANVFPYFGGLRYGHGSGGHKKIYADEYGYANFMCNAGTILEAVTIYWGQSSATSIVNGDVAPISQTDFCNPAGAFPRDVNQRDYRGTILVKEPPNWVTNYVNGPMFTNSSTAEPGDVTTPDHGSDTPPGGTPPRAALHNQITQSNILDKFAEQWFKSEFLQQRYGEISGKLRFDIAPGTIVKVEAPKKTMPDLAAYNEELDMVGMVAQVSFVINAELAQAGTSFSLTNIRTVKEDQDDKKTATKPPLYTRGWGGDVLARKAK